MARGDSEVYSATSLAAWGLLESARLEAVRDQLIADIEPPQSAVMEVLRQHWFYGKGLHTLVSQEQWRSRMGLSTEQLDCVVSRSWRWQQWCERQFGPKISSYFLARKDRLDRVQIWMLWAPDEELAGELYQRLRGGECGFETLLDPVLESVGCKVELRGPQLLEAMPDEIATLLRVSEPGKLWPPRPCVGGGWQVVRLQSRWSAVLDQETRLRLLEEMGERFLDSLGGTGGAH